MSDYLKKRQEIMMGIREKDPPKEKKLIPKKSAKRVKEDKDLKKIREEMIEEKGNRCFIQSPDCLGFVQGVNHIQKTSPSNRLEKENLELACNPCNAYVETHQEWAEVNGHWKSRFTVHDEVESVKTTIHDKV